MIVVALIAGVSGMGIWTLSGSLRVQESADLARGVASGMMRARSEAVGDGFQRRLNCTAIGCALQIAGTAGMAAPATWNAGGWSVWSGTQAQVWAIDGATDVGTTNPGAGPLSGTRSVTFFPDGTASAATVFIEDARSTQRYKVFVYPATGMQRVVDQW